MILGVAREADVNRLRAKSRGGDLTVGVGLLKKLESRCDTLTVEVGCPRE